MNANAPKIGVVSANVARDLQRTSVTGMAPTLVVLAAGMGSRYGGLKQIDPMGPSGETILDYSVFDALRAGFGRVVFIIRPDFEDAFRTGVAAKFSDRVDVDFAFQTLDRFPMASPFPRAAKSHGERRTRFSVLVRPSSAILRSSTQTISMVAIPTRFSRTT